MAALLRGRAGRRKNVIARNEVTKQSAVNNIHHQVSSIMDKRRCKMRLKITKSSASALSDDERKEKIISFIRESSVESSNGRLLEDFESRVKHFETIYSIPSSKIKEALESGNIKETEEIVQWIFAYSILKGAGRV